MSLTAAISPMTLRQLQQVSLTYLTRPTATGWCVIVGFCLLLVAVVSLNAGEVDGNAAYTQTLSILVLISCLCVWPATALKNQLTWQFANPRSRLIPGYAAPHVAVWLIAHLSISLFLPYAIALWLDVSGLFFAAWCTLVITLIIMGENSSYFSWLLFAPILLTSSASVTSLDVSGWIQGEGYRRFLAATAIFICGLLTWRRLSSFMKLDEEDPRYDIPAWGMANNQSARPFRLAMSAAENSGGDGELAASSSHLDQMLRRASAWPTWRRLRVVAARRFDLKLVGRAMAIFAAIALLRWKMGHSMPLTVESWESAIHILPIVVLMAGLTPCVLMAKRIPQMASEKLLPMSNRTYADALLINAAISSLQSWAAALAVAAFFTYAIPWEGLDPPALSRAVSYLLISAAGLIATFGTAAYFSVFDGIFGAVVASVVGILATLVLQSFWFTLLPHESEITAFVGAAAFATGGLWLANHARSAWRNKELP
jgi:hypothetical protein